MLRTLRANRFEPYKTVAEGLGDTTASKVRRVARSHGYHRYVARRKPFLTRVAAAKRLAWARESEGRDWKTVIWTDEASFELGKRIGQCRVTRRINEDLCLENIQPTFRSGRKSFMVWACIAHCRKGPLIRLDLESEPVDQPGMKMGKGLNGAKYAAQVIRGPMREFYLQMVEERRVDMLVVEDNAPSHSSKIAKHARSELGIHTLTHLPTSPDLNPIEPLWLTLKRRVDKIRGSHHSLDNLWAAVQRVWDELSVEDIQAHTGKMDARVLAVKKAKGWYTQF